MDAGKRIKQVVVAVIGLTVVALGIALLVLPGPAFVVIPLGLGILGTEFLWARRALRKIREKVTGQTGDHHGGNGKETR